ncbi:MAG: peptidase domain-containing ABC transporter [Planctomycetes bacterium]|nr:peptidase domain-containing ABC transporter [Planctomycetota bacterium]
MEIDDAESRRRVATRPAWRRRLRPHLLVRSRDESDCGAACLATVAAQHGCPQPLARLRELTEIGADGCSMWSIARGAEQLGFHARGVRVTVAQLPRLALPAIVSWRGSHFVVVHGVTRRGVVVADPGIGVRRIDREEFAAGFTGAALELVPTARLVAAAPRLGVLRRFAPVLWPFRRMLAEVLLASLLLSALGLGTPLALQLVVDRVLVDGSLGFLDMLLVALLLVAGFTAALRSVRQLLLVHVSTQVDARLIADFLRQVFRLPLRHFESHRVGDVVTRVTENQRLRAALAETLPAVVLDGVLASGYLALLACYDLRMTGIVLAILLAFVALIGAFTPVLRRHEREEFDKRSAATDFLIEAVAGIASVKSMAIESRVREQMESLYTESLLAARRGELAATAYFGLAVLLQCASTGLFLWIGARGVLGAGLAAGELSTGQLLAFVTVAANVVGPVASLVQSWNRLQEARNAAERLADVFDVAPEQDERRSLLRPARLDGRIELRGVRFCHGGEGDRPQLDAIDLTIEPGERVAIVGASGSGKTTLVKLILGLYAPTAGQVLIDGHDLRGISLPHLRRRVGFVPQEVTLFSGTLRDNVAVRDPDAPLGEVAAAARLAGLHELVQQSPLGYDTVVGRRGVTLSGGERQRVALARALLGDPDLLILDEPTAALDPVSERAIQTQLERVAAGRTTIVVAHRMATVRRADRIVVMDGGRIVEQGTHEELVARGGRYRELTGDPRAA